MEVVLRIIFLIILGILFDLWHKYAYKRCIRYKRCREWMCKYYHECKYADEREEQE